MTEWELARWNVKIRHLTGKISTEIFIWNRNNNYSKKKNKKWADIKSWQAQTSWSRNLLLNCNEAQCDQRPNSNWTLKLRLYRLLHDPSKSECHSLYNVKHLKTTGDKYEDIMSHFDAYFSSNTHSHNAFQPLDRPSQDLNYIIPFVHVYIVHRNSIVRQMDKVYTMNHTLTLTHTQTDKTRFRSDNPKCHAIRFIVFFKVEHLKIRNCNKKELFV